MSKSKLEVNLKDAVLSHKKKLADIQTLNRLIAESKIEISDVALSAATVALEDCTVRHALNEATADELEQCKKALIAEENAYQSAKRAQKESEMKQAGFRRRLDTVEQEALAEREKVKQLEIEWLALQISSAEDVYFAAAEKLRNSYRRIMACAKAMAQRDAVASASVVYSAEIMIPAIGSECVMNALPGENRAGGYYFRESRPVADFGATNIEAELNAISDVNSDVGSTLKKMVGSLSSGNKAPTV